MNINLNTIHLKIPYRKNPEIFSARRHQLYGFPDHRHEQAGGEGRHPRHRQQGDLPGQDD